MIPKIIHYCWLSDDPYNELQHKCINSWKTKLYDYQLIKWDQSKNDEIASRFYQSMLKGEDWAYASDYVRLFALYHYGGFYLDIDVESVRSLNSLLDNQLVVGLEDNDEASIGCHLMGSVPKHPLIGECLRYYDHSFKLRWSSPPTMPRIVTKIARKSYGYDGKPVGSSKGMRVFPAEYFSPISYKQRLLDIPSNTYVTNNTYAIHYWEHSWNWFDDPMLSMVKKLPWLFMKLSDWKFVLKQLLMKK